MSRLTMVLMLVAGMLLLGAGVSGFVSDAEVSATRLGSDFDDSRYHQFDSLSMERVQQRTRREQIGMEAVAGAGLMIVAMVFFTPRRKAPGKPVRFAEAQATAASRRKVQALPPAAVIQEQYAARRRRPNSSLHAQVGRAKQESV